MKELWRVARDRTGTLRRISVKNVPLVFIYSECIYLFAYILHIQYIHIAAYIYMY